MHLRALPAKRPRAAGSVSESSTTRRHNGEIVIVVVLNPLAACFAVAVERQGRFSLTAIERSGGMT